MSVAILGLGLTGMSILHYLIKIGEEKIICLDDKSEAIERCRNIVSSTDGAKNIKPILVQDDYFEVLVQHDVKLVYVSPGFVKNSALLAKIASANMKISSDMDILHRDASDMLHIGVTGTNGKSTVCSWLKHALDRLRPNDNIMLVGNIGNPVCDILGDVKSGICISEISCYQLDLAANINFDIAVLLNISEDHLDVYGDINNYASSKAQIFSFLKDGCDAIIASHDKYSVQIGSNLSERVVFHGPDAINGRFESAKGGSAEAINEEVVFYVLSQLGYDDIAILDAMSGFKRLPHRCEFVCEYRGWKCINDSKATNFDSVRVAMNIYGNMHWIAGGQRKGDEIKLPESALPRIVCAYIIGKDMSDLQHFCEDHGINYVLCKTLDVALYKIKGNIDSDVPNSYPSIYEKEAENVVLFSPGCASFDQWRNFEERGDGFKKIVSSW